MSKHGRIGDAAMKADMHRETARKYVAAGKLPSEMTVVRDWRTRPDPFEEHWPEIEARLRDTPELEAKTVFELLQQAHPGRYEEGQLRTLCRVVQRAVFQLGRVPRYHQTDCSTAATHRIPDGQAAYFEDGKRPFNAEYVALMRHLG